MKLYWNTIAHPTQDKWLRRFTALVFLATFTPNVVVTFMRMATQDPRAWWNASVFVFVGFFWVWEFSRWAKKDVDNREALKRIATEPLPEDTLSAGVRVMNGKWVCTKCAREAALGYDDGQLPEHFRTCPKAAAS